MFKVTTIFKQSKNYAYVRNRFDSRICHIFAISTLSKLTSGKIEANNFGNNRMRSNSTSNLSRLSALRKSNQLRIDQPIQGGFDVDER